MPLPSPGTDGLLLPVPMTRPWHLLPTFQTGRRDAGPGSNCVFLESPRLPQEAGTAAWVAQQSSGGLVLVPSCLCLHLCDPEGTTASAPAQKPGATMSHACDRQDASQGNQLVSLAFSVLQLLVG